MKVRNSYVDKFFCVRRRECDARKETPLGDQPSAKHTFETSCRSPVRARRTIHTSRPALSSCKRVSPRCRNQVRDPPRHAADHTSCCVGWMGPLQQLVAPPSRPLEPCRHSERPLNDRATL